MELSERLRNYVDASGLPVVEVVRRSGVSKSYVEALLCGSRKRISVDKAKALAGALGVKLNELVNDEEPPATTAELVEELHRRMLASSMVDVPVRGCVPCYGETREQTGVMPIPKQLKGGRERVFVTEVGGIVEGERFQVGDRLVVDPGEDIGETGGVFVVFVEGQTVVRRAWRDGGDIHVRPDIGAAGVFPIGNVKVVGRVLARYQLEMVL